MYVYIIRLKYGVMTTSVTASLSFGIFSVCFKKCSGLEQPCDVQSISSDNIVKLMLIVSKAVIQAIVGDLDLKFST